MVKLGLLVAVGAIGAAVAYPMAEEDQTGDSEREFQLRQGGALAGIFGQIGTALVPLFGAVLGPILTNLATGIANAFNSGLNPNAAAPSKEESASSEESAGPEASGLVVRIPQDSPLYGFLLAHPSVDKEGLQSVGPAAGASAQKPLAFGGKFAAAFHPVTSDPAPVHVVDRDSVSVDGPDDAEEEEEENAVARNPNVRLYPQRVRTETEYA